MQKKMYIFQAHFDFTNLGSEMHHSCFIAIWNSEKWSWSPCVQLMTWKDFLSKIFLNSCQLNQIVILSVINLVQNLSGLGLTGLKVFGFSLFEFVNIHPKYTFSQTWFKTSQRSVMRVTYQVFMERISLKHNEICWFWYFSEKEAFSFDWDNPSFTFIVL